MSHLTISLLGQPQIELNEELITIGRKKAIALLAYLAIQGQPVRRATLATLLWPEAQQNRASLRTTLSHLTKKLGHNWFDSQRQCIGLNFKTDIWLDVTRFQALLTECATHGHVSTKPCVACQPLLVEAIALYQADFLQGFTLTDSSPWDNWQSYQTEALRRAFAEALAQLIHYYEQQNLLQPAITYAQRLVVFDRLNEPARRQLMQLLHKSGQTAVAIQQYEQLARLLEQELGIELQPETIEVYHQIRQPPLTVSNAPARAIANDLPQPMTRFIGRQIELDEIKARLNTPNCRLLTIMGPGGVGKSRLAIATATQLRETYQYGTCYIPLAATESPTLLVTAMANALNVRFYGAGENLAQLVNYLREKEILLILDNFEHLVAGAEILLTIVQNAPKIKLLITSRISLNLHVEWLYELEGLPYPKEKQAETERIAASDAGQLFFQSASRVNAHFAPQLADLQAIGQICHLVEGLPLGIELAASLTRAFSCTDIALEISQNLGFLTTTARDLPERHQSLQAVFQMSWQQLSPAEQKSFMKLSVFHGGFTREAATVVTGANPATLLGLVDSSFLRLLPTGRYDIHEVLRWFGSEKLSIRLAERKQVKNAHSRYFTQFLDQRKEALLCSEVVQTLQEISEELENIRTAWSWAASEIRETDIAQAMEPLYQFYRIRSWLSEGKDIFAMAVAKLTNSGESLVDIPHTKKKLMGRLLAYQSWFCWNLAEYSLANILLEQAMSLVQQVDDKQYLAFLLLIKGAIVTFEQGDHFQAKELYRQGYDLYKDLEHQLGMAKSLSNMGISSLNIGEYKTAKQLYEDSVAICQAIDYRDQFVSSILNLGVLSENLGQYSEAITAYQTCFELCQEAENTLGMLISLINQSEVMLRMKRYQDARDLSQQQLLLSRDIGDRFYLVGSLAALGNAYYMLDDFTAAWQSLQESLDLVISIASKPYTALVLAQIARLLFRLEQLEPSLILLIVTRTLVPAQHHQGNPENLYEILTTKISPEKVRVLEATWQNKDLNEAVKIAQHEFEKYMECVEMTD